MPLTEKIYTSPFPPTLIKASSVFTHLWGVSHGKPDFVGQYPGQLKAYVDAETGATLTRNQVRDLALRVGWALKWHEEIKAKRGEVVMIFSPNSLNWPVAIFGSVTAGLRCTPANSAYMPEKLMLQYEDSGAKIVFVAEELVSVVLEMFKLLGVAELEARRRIIVLENGLEWAGGPPASKVNAAKGLKTLADLMKAGGKLDREENFDGEQANETVYLCYSSGTTGRSKGVETTHFNINAAQEILRPPFPKLYPGKDLMLGMLPFYHIYGMVELLHFPILCGIPVVIMPRFDPVKFCAYIDQYMITTILIVPPILLVLASHPAVDNYDMSSLKTLVSGAAPLGPGLVNQVTKRLRFRRNRKDDVVISQGYGLTETSPSTHFLPVSDAVRKVGSIGILLPDLEARLVVDVGAEANEGEPGELWIRGPTVMKGYLNNVAATKDSITPDGWFKTGDIATRDPEGFYYVVDRKKELIKYKGFQVAPAELEGLLLNYPDVADAAVIGVYSESRATELPRAYVVHAHPERLKIQADKVAFQQDVLKWTHERVARHKFLRGGVVAIDIIPKSASGKILRRELREKAKVELKRQDLAAEQLEVKVNL